MEKGTILVIEDTTLNMKLVRTLLQLREYTVLEATAAEKGIELAREHHPDLILMDIQLPGMDGLTATRLIRQDPELKEMTVVALTSHAMQGDEEKAIAAGCEGHRTHKQRTDYSGKFSEHVKKSKKLSGFSLRY